MLHQDVHYDKGILNADSLPELIGKGEHINMSDFRFGTTDAGFVEGLESVGSTILKSSFAPSVTHITIGAVADVENDRILYFRYNIHTDEHNILCYNLLTDDVLLVLNSSDTQEGLNFTKEVIHSSRIVNGSLCWVDSTNNEPRSLNINSAIKLSNPSLYTHPETTQVLFVAPAITFTAPNMFSTPFGYPGLYVFTVGQFINISGTANNNGFYTVTSVTGPFNRDVRVSGPIVNEAGTAVAISQAAHVDTVQPYGKPVLYTDLTIIRRPPIYAIQYVKLYNSFFSGNYIADQAYQVTYRYNYKNFQISALSTYSKLVPYNNATETFNHVQFTISSSEVIDDYVQSIDMCVKYGNTGKTFIIKTWDKNNATDAMEIAQHNAGITSLTYDFYDDLSGIPLDDVNSVNNFDLVPIYSEALEAARNRLFLGNNTTGYTSPATTSLTTSLTTIDTGGGGDGSYAGNWGYLQLRANYVDGHSFGNNFYYPIFKTDVGSGAPHVYYYFPAVHDSTFSSEFEVWYQMPGPVPPTVNLSDASFGTDIEADMITYLRETQYPNATGQPAVTPGAPWTFFEVTNYGLGAGTILTYTPESVNRFFKSGSTYFASIAFFDRYRRKSGVVNVKVKSVIPERTYTQTSFSTGIQWLLDNTNAINEIPDWAFYYQIHITKNQTTRYFLQAIATDSSYAFKDNDGLITYGHLAYDPKVYAIALSLQDMNGFGYGYAYTPGDFVKIHLDAVTNYNIPVIGLDGAWLLCKPYNITPTLTDATNIIFEIYTPYRASVIEPFYETGDVYAVANPGTPGRSYGTLAGVINGDTYALERTRSSDSSGYITEAMSPNDNKYKEWQTDTGWVNYVDSIGQVVKESTFVFSDTFIPGTRINGLNKFQPLNSENVGTEVGSLSKLQLTSKVQEEVGTVMLAICSKETVSMYLGETQVTAAAANTFVAVSDNVVGTKNILKGSYGTRHAESVSEFRGQVYWWDDVNAKVIQYSVNGLEPISSYRMTRFWKQFTEAFLKAGLDRPYVVVTVDPHHNEVLFSIPQVLSNPPKGYLLDYPSTPYPFDIFDGRAKTIVYKLGLGEPRFQGSYSFAPEYFVTLNSNLYSFKNGQIYLHNSTTSDCNYYGTQYDPKVMVVSNEEPLLPKTFENNTVNCNYVPYLAYFMTEYPYLQITDIADFEWENKEGQWYKELHRNKIQPTQSGMNLDGLLVAEKLRALYMLAMYQWKTVPGKKINVKFLSIGYAISLGHTG